MYPQLWELLQFDEGCFNKVPRGFELLPQATSLSIHPQRQQELHALPPHACTSTNVADPGLPDALL